MADVDTTPASHVQLGSAAGSAGHGPDDEDERPEPLGEPDLRGWGAALMGGGISVLVAISLFIATQA
jgi:hypothetical protein